jgi:hypothetical protein
MKRPFQILMLTLLATGLIACGPARKSVFPPTLSIQQLVQQPDGEWRLTVRIQNNSYDEMDFKSIEGRLQIAALIPIRLHARFERDIPELAGDVIEIDVLPTPAMSLALQATAGKGSAAAVAYRISGSASARPEQEKQPRDFSFDGSGWISPVPGIANTWR